MLQNTRKRVFIEKIFKVIINLNSFLKAFVFVALKKSNNKCFQNSLLEKIEIAYTVGYVVSLSFLVSAIFVFAILKLVSFLNKPFCVVSIVFVSYAVYLLAFKNQQKVLKNLTSNKLPTLNFKLFNV